MEQNQEYFNDFLVPGQTCELTLDADMMGWQPFSTPNKFEMQKQFLNSQIFAPKKCYEDGSTAFPDEQNHREERFMLSSYYQKREQPENIVTADFLSAIPYARQSKTVKRKLNFEEDGVTKAEDTLQKPKTYFPFEFIGHASRQSVSQLNSAVLSNKENERGLNNSTMIIGCALHKSDLNGNLPKTVFSTVENEFQPTRGKRAKKISSKNKTNSVVALEQHFEQIRRKHAEFNWDIPNSQKVFKDEEQFSRDVDIQRVPTIPFVEQYSSPSMYSSNETPLQTSMSNWMPLPTPRLCMQNFEQERNQRFQTEVYTNSAPSSINPVMIQEFNDTPCSGDMSHLYPY